VRAVEISLHRARLPLVHGFETSSHRKAELEHVLVRFTDEGGTVGWGEIASPSAPYFCAENVETAWSIASDYLVPAILGACWEEPAEVPALLRRIRGNYFAIAGFDMAGWAMWSACRGISLAHALGGTRTRVEAGVSLGIERDIDSLLEQVARHVAAGYPRVKLKIAPGWELEPVRAVVAAFPRTRVHVDANGVYGPDDIDRLTAFDSLGLDMIEQPFGVRDFLTHARFQERVETPVCLDESIESLDDLRTMLALRAGRIVNVKVSRVGGLSAARGLHDVARESGVPVWCGGMHEFGVGRLANVALSSLPGFTLPSDVSASSKYYARDVISPPVIAERGFVAVPAAAGLGAEVDEEFLAEIEVDRRVFRR
jgi:O-succinylbenzoate synthase